MTREKTGKPNSFGHNKKVRRLTAKSAKAVKEFNSPGYNAKNLPPSAVEILTLRFCSPHGEGNGSIFAMLGEIDCLHLGDTKLPGGTKTPVLFVSLAECAPHKGRE